MIKPTREQRLKNTPSKNTIRVKLPIRFYDDDTTVSKDKFCLNGHIKIDMSKINVQLDKFIDSDGKQEITYIMTSIARNLQRRLKK